MDQWKLIISALLLTLFLPLLLWTSLFAFFGWKLFLFLLVGVGALLLFGETIIHLPLFKGLVRMLLPFGMTYRFYRALLAGKEVREQDGNSLQAWWATFRRLLKEKDPSSEIEESEQIGLPEATTFKKKQLKRQRATSVSAGTRGKEQSSPVESCNFPRLDSIPFTESDTPKPVSSPRSHRPNEAELDEMLLDLKAKMEKE